MSNVITKGITSTVVSGFELKDGMPVPVTVTLEGAVTKERAEGTIRRQHGQMLISNVEQVRAYYQLDRAIAMENATSERTSRDDITLGETSTTVYFLKLVENGKKEVEEGHIVLNGAMTESRAFGAARRALTFDILPYAAEQTRAKCFISREKFFELATPCDASEVSEEGEEAEA